MFFVAICLQRRACPMWPTPWEKGLNMTITRSYIHKVKGAQNANFTDYKNPSFPSGSWSPRAAQADESAAILYGPLLVDCHAEALWRFQVINSLFYDASYYLMFVFCDPWSDASFCDFFYVPFMYVMELIISQSERKVFIRGRWHIIWTIMRHIAYAKKL